MISEKRSKIDVLLDNIEDAIEEIDTAKTDIKDYISEIRELLVESGERLGD